MPELRIGTTPIKWALASAVAIVACIAAIAVCFALTGHADYAMEVTKYLIGGLGSIIGALMFFWFLFIVGLSD